MAGEKLLHQVWFCHYELELQLNTMGDKFLPSTMLWSAYYAKRYHHEQDISLLKTVTAHVTSDVYLEIFRFFFFDKLSDYSS